MTHGLLALEGVEDGLRLLLEVGGLLRVVAEDEGSGDEAEQEGEEVGNHVIQKEKIERTLR